MCGRYTQKTPAKKLAQQFGVDEAPVLEARYNIAPGQDVPAVSQSPDGRVLSFYRWGLIPSWAKDISMSSRLINARSETVAEKPAFRQAFKQRRLLIPADGFYEWQRMEGRKQPFFFRMRDESPFAFAGFWERWKDVENDAVINSCTILTTAANEVLQSVHDRMPVILHPDDYDLWLDGDARKLDLVKEMLQPFPAEEMIGYPVSVLINNPRNQGVELTERKEL